QQLQFVFQGIHGGGLDDRPAPQIFNQLVATVRAAEVFGVQRVQQDHVERACAGISRNVGEQVGFARDLGDGPVLPEGKAADLLRLVVFQDGEVIDSKIGHGRALAV